MASPRNHPGPAYERIAAELRRAMANGRIPAGAKLPSERDLAAAKQVSLMTARRALCELERQGLVTRRTGAGTFAAPVPAGVRRLRDPHEEFAAPECRCQGAVREWWSAAGKIVEEQITLAPEGALGARPLLEFLEGAAVCAVEEIRAEGDVLRISQTLYGEDQAPLAARELRVFGRPVTSLLAKR